MRLNIIIIAMLLGVIGILFFINGTIHDAEARVVALYNKQFGDLLAKEQAQYKTYKWERDQDFKSFIAQSEKDFTDFKQQTSNLMMASLSKTQETADRILLIVDSKLNQQGQTIRQAAQQVTDKPRIVRTVVRHTEVISDDELKRREKIKEQWRKYYQDKAEWQAKYGHRKTGTKK
jgi:hypothetical protein